MERQKKSDKRHGYSRLRLATIDGVSLPGLQLPLDRQEGSGSTKKPFFQQWLLDFAFGCELFYPIQLYEHLATSEGDDKGAQSESYEYGLGRIRAGRHVPHLKSTSLGSSYSRMEAPAQAPTLANSKNRSPDGWRILWTTWMRRNQRTARTHKFQQVRTSTAGTSKDGKKDFRNLTTIRYTQAAVQILLPLSYILATLAHGRKSRIFGPQGSPNYTAERISFSMSLCSAKCIRIAALAATAIVLGTQIAIAQEPSIGSQWLNTPASRVEALAVLQTLNANLLSNASATLTLDRWCAAHKLAPKGSKIVAQRVDRQGKPADEHIHELLTVGPGELIAYRRVRLVCGDRVLSEADNWYVPAKLTAEMNRALNTSDIAFGRAVQALNFTRTNLSAKLLWSPLSEGWDMDGLITHKTSSLSLPPFLLEHRAILKLQDGTPFSALVESYTDKVLDFPVPRLLSQ